LLGDSTDAMQLLLADALLKEDAAALTQVFVAAAAAAGRTEAVKVLMNERRLKLLE
jgi:hypothetical protein